MCLSIGIDMSVHFPIFKFSIIYSYIILNLSPMQIVFNLKNCEEPRQNQTITDAFSPCSIYCDPSPGLHQEGEQKRNDNKTEIQFPLKVMKWYLKKVI